MEETLQEKIEDLEYQIKKIDGKTWGLALGNRIYGALGIALPIFMYYASGKNPWTLIATPLIIDGVGDLITGKHHFLSYRLFKTHPKYELDKILKQIP